PLGVGYHNNATVKLSDVANVQDSTENIRAAGFTNGKPSVLIIIYRQPGANMIPAVAVPVSLIGTFGVMYLCHYSVDNLSLMALTISTGFVVDDAIVV